MRQEALPITRWADVTRIRARFQRSINLERDSNDPRWIEGYVVTSLVRSTLHRMANGLRRDGTARAWSLTGPYGSGKSAFAVFLTNLVANASVENRARRLLIRADRGVSAAWFDPTGALEGKDGALLAVRATGERSNLDQILISALKRAYLQAFRSPTKRALYHDISAEERKAEKGRASARRTVGLFERAAAEVRRSGMGKGLVIVLDEAGKILEHAAGTTGDVSLLQEFAEAANRSGDNKLLFVVSLHQGFESYASRLSAQQRNEWAKIQGRFEDVPFQEASEQILALIGAAIDRREMPEALEGSGMRAINAVLAAGRYTPSERDRLKQHLWDTLPLHPATALVLGPLFRTRMAQNERSLFAFLASKEPAGFQSFLAAQGTPNEAEPFFRLDHLYDYVLHSVRSNLTSHHARCWLQAENAIGRLPADSGPLEVRILKAIAVLNALGDAHGLFPSEALLAAAIATDTRAGLADLRKALARLQANSLLVYRKFKDSFQLWDGSDIDIESLVEASLKDVDARASLVPKLEKLAPPRPIVARRHLFETGTFRYFEFRYADETLLASGLPAPNIDADGVIWILVPTNEGCIAELRTKLSAPELWGDATTTSRPRFVLLPDEVSRVRHLALELVALDRVRAGQPKLQSDPVARRELGDRIAEAERRLMAELDGLTNGHCAAAWYGAGHVRRVRSARELLALLSDACDRAYEEAPFIFNELLNREHLSSSAAAARRTLMQAMVEHANEERLGIDGNPPELSMYRSLLEKHGLHRADGKTWGFRSPLGTKNRGSMKRAYQSILDTMAAHDSRRMSVAEVYRQLQRPPFGIKSGVLPVLFLAAVLDRNDEVALYEDGVFTPALTSAMVERLLRSPEKFEIQYTAVVGTRAQAVESLSGHSGPGGLLALVRQIVRLVAALPDYSKNTKSISATAQAVREAVLRAKEPAPLIFEQLPRALGLNDLTLDAEGAVVDAMAPALKAALREVSGAYSALLKGVQTAVFAAFGVDHLSIETARAELQGRAAELQPHATDAGLKGLLIRLADENMTSDDWLVSVATLLGGKPPEHWYDRDHEQMKLMLSQLARKFRSLEAVVLEQLRAGDGVRRIRVSVTEPSGVECERVVPVREGEQKALTSFISRIREQVEGTAGELSHETLLAGLAIATRELISELNREVAPRQLEN